MIHKAFIVALEEIGVTEIPGPENSPRIAEYLRSVDLPGIDKIPHCAAFVNWCIVQTGQAGTKSGLARSFLNYGYEIKEPRVGCIVVLRRGLDKRKGHVGWFLDEHGGFIRILGANQKDRVGVNAYSKLRLLSYRWDMRFSYQRRY